MAAPRGEQGYFGFARTSRRNTSTCAGRRGRASAKRDTAMSSAKPCYMLPVTTPTVLGSSSRSYVVPLEAPQGSLTNVPFYLSELITNPPPPSCDSYKCTQQRRSVVSDVACLCFCSAAPGRQQKADTGTCTGSTKGQACNNRALPFTRHCFQRILSTTSLFTCIAGCYK